MTATHLVAISDPIAMAPQRWHNNRQRRLNNTKARTANIGGHNGQRGRQALIKIDYERNGQHCHHRCPQSSSMASPMPQWARMASPMPRTLNNGFTSAENGREWPRQCQKLSKRPINAATMANNDESLRRYL